VCFTSPGGRAAHIDPNSLGFARGPRRARALATAARPRAALDDPRPLAAWRADEGERFAAVLLPGGHAPMADLVDDPGLGRVLRRFHARARPTAAVCHGVVGLLSARERDGTWPYAGYRMTCFPRYTERVLEWTGALGGRVPFYVDGALTGAGAVVRNRIPPFIPRVVRDRELITGQDPFAAAKLGRVLVDAIAAS
jgi:putative intracellular protease/amidase